MNILPSATNTFFTSTKCDLRRAEVPQRDHEASPTAQEKAADRPIDQSKIEKKRATINALREVEKQQHEADINEAEQELLALQGTPVTKEQLLNMDITDAFEALGLNSDYSSRRLLAKNLFKEGVDLFPGTLNHYFDAEEIKQDEQEFGDRTWYIGNLQQNAKFVRNLAENLHLFNNGQLVSELDQKWVIVD